MPPEQRVPEAEEARGTPQLWRCPKHGLIEPYHHSPEWGSGEPGEYGTCPIMEDEDTGCGRVMDPVPPLGKAEPALPELNKARDDVLRERLEAKLRAAYIAGFAESGEGHNGEYPEEVDVDLPPYFLSREADHYALAALTAIFEEDGQ